MRTLICVGIAAGALFAGVGQAAAAPLPLIDVSGTPAATDTSGSGGGSTGSASQSAQSMGTLFCLLTNGHCWGEGGPVG
ncbi:hypothetical protein ACFXHA_14670 [Nocardia sp. NPDC059240]|uniref:hypothetical protein n=1 Tax=Nocardia sp. NPDC059240 TaxID=3346786 RepID=UPI00368667B2